MALLPAITKAQSSLGAKKLVQPQPDGTIVFNAKDATVHGTTLYARDFDDTGDLCTWTNPQEWVSWQFQLNRPGDYVVDFRYSCPRGSLGSTFAVTVDDARLTGEIAQPTASWDDHVRLQIGTVKLEHPGMLELGIKPQHKPRVAVMNLTRVRLVPAAIYEAKLQEEARQKFAGLDRAVFLVPNFHPASCGWLTDFSTERNYCAYSYLTHLDRVRDDPNYAFALSEVNNQMAILAFEPQRFEELKERIREGRVELCNAFFLEPTINLSGGEALVKIGVEGLRWQQQVMGVRPRLAWMIDITGLHEQMAQIVAGLGLDALIYTRENPTGSTLHWQESPDGTRILSLSPGHYSDFGPVFATKDALTEDQLAQLGRDLRGRARRTPSGAPPLVLGGSGDYSTAPARKSYPTEFIQQWAEVAPNAPIKFTGPSRYLDAVLPLVRSGELKLPTSHSGARLTWSSFWIQCPTVKQLYRQSEHALQAAESLATFASLKSAFAYPVAPLYHAWLEMCLNMDRNTLWGAAGGMVFEHPTSWDARDRFDSVQKIAGDNSAGAIRSLLGTGEAVGLFNALNWQRSDPFQVTLPAGTRFTGAQCQAAGDGQTLSRVNMASLSLAGLQLEQAAPAPASPVDLPPTIETKYYRARIDPATGALVSLQLKPSGHEILAGPVLLVAEQGGDGHNTPRRPQRKRLADSAKYPAQISVSRGPLATVVSIRSTFYGGGELRQIMRFYDEYPRIDFDTECNDIPNKTVVVAEFPLAREIKETRRGIPYGFSHGAWAVPNSALHGFADGILAAIRWSDYEFTDGGGVALLDRGLPGRELTGKTPLLFLLNAQDTYLGYKCAWLSGKGRHSASYALVAHDSDWKSAGIPRMAWEFNCPPLVTPGVGIAEPLSFATTSDNVIVEAVRREGDFIEIRLAESLGLAGKASVTLSLPHQQAMLTDLIGGHPQTLSGGPNYEFPVRSQRIVTLRFKTSQPVAAIQPLLKWDELVPPSKLPALQKRLPGRVGHPPRGSEN